MRRSLVQFWVAAHFFIFFFAVFLYAVCYLFSCLLFNIYCRLLLIFLPTIFPFVLSVFVKETHEFGAEVACVEATTDHSLGVPAKKSLI